MIIYASLNYLKVNNSVNICVTGMQKKKKCNRVVPGYQLQFKKKISTWKNMKKLITIA